MNGEMRIDPLDLPRLKARHGAGWVIETARENGAPISGDMLDPDYDWDFWTDHATGEQVLQWSRDDD